MDWLEYSPINFFNVGLIQVVNDWIDFERFTWFISPCSVVKKTQVLQNIKRAISGDHVLDAIIPNELIDSLVLS